MTKASFKKAALAFGLSTILVLGTVVLPLSHYGWMLISGRFEQHKEHASAMAMSGPHAAHQAQSAAPDLTTMAPMGASLKEANPVRISCDYSTTIVQNPVVVCDHAFVSFVVPASGLLIEQLVIEADVQSQNRLPWFRGPPIV